MGMTSFCRDCFHTGGFRSRCPRCGSPRLICHGQLDALAIAHVDCDAFYAAVEKRDNPDLLDKAVIIGGGRRGVVSTACYNARIYGVKSAMPMFKALELCPDAVVVRPDMDKYVRVGRQVRRLMLNLTPAVEPLSIDEAFLDLTGTALLHGELPAIVLARFAARVEAEIGITLSVGLSANKFLAKIASDLDKPRGFSVLSPDEAPAFLAPRPVSFIYGVGKATAATLEKDGYRTIKDLQQADPTTLARRYGSMGMRLAELAFGRDRRRVDPEEEVKSISNEITFDEDISDLKTLETMIWRLSEKVAQRMRAASLAGYTLTLKLKTADFKTKTRSRRFADPTNLAHRIDEAARDLLVPEANGQRYRLIGVGLSDLHNEDGADPHDLIEPKRDKEKAVEQALELVRSKFGKEIIRSGKSLRDI